ncbi:universal stress protein [Phaeodactylibacter xiamenensis]|uniref:universal stress protein n=1 Tax=Phaeodactylibacter xiamenensis TaxID=1524460 RepID=UPI0024A7EB47|nr:universal stress protein [Phaeodactylibacter xiamenensis]
MRKILVPTDFSATAANACQFAQVVAERQNAEVDIMHAYHPSFDYSNPYLDMPAAEFDSIKRELLDQFIEGNTRDSGSSVATLPKPILNIGFASEEIVRMSKGYDLIIMGTTGEGNLLEKAFGSVSTHVARFAHCPVLLVPGNCKCGNFEEVVYASNYQAADEAMVKKLLTITGPEINNIHFVHIDNETKSPYHVEQVLYEQAQLYGTAAIGFNSVEIECPNVQEGIVQYASDIRADLIVMGTMHRNFLERLFHKSVTQQVVFHTTVPLLVMHYDD